MIIYIMYNNKYWQYLCISQEKGERRQEKGERRKGKGDRGNL